MLKIALTKGRIEKKSTELFKQMGFDTSELENKGRKLILNLNENVSVLIAKPNDVITYVTRGICDLGIVGNDTIVETGGSFFVISDLGFGKCKFALAGKAGTDFYSENRHKIIATKYPNVARRFFEKKNMDIEIIKIEGSVELAPILGLADAIVDIVETGETLKENGLEIIEYISDISSRLIVNSASLKFKSNEINEFIDKI
ncbi:MAG: ATP phosphoribosyltransferase [Ruminococcus sp.]|jgi:ATP phosphoribosyltransferase|nr:ATP phosphoribosyltransferase [Ruminococcus sp.]